MAPPQPPGLNRYDALVNRDEHGQEVDDQGNPMDWGTGPLDESEDVSSAAPQTSVDALTARTARLDTRDRHYDPPTAEARQNLQDAIKRKQKDMDQKDAEELQRKRARRAGKQPEEKVVAKITPPAQQFTSGDDFLAIRNPEPRAFCAVMVHDESQTPGVTTKPIGGIYRSDPPLPYWISLSVEAGRYGRPHFTLQFTFMGAVSEQGPNDKVKTKKASITWRPGVAIQNKWMIESFSMKMMSQFAEGQHPHFPDIYANAPEVKKNVAATKILAMGFTSNSRIIKDADREAWKHVSPNDKVTLERLFYGEGSFFVTVWAEYRANPTLSFQQWGLYFAEAVNQHKPPLWQYQNANGELVCSFDETPEINELGGGMYRIGSTPEGTARSYYKFPKVLNWMTHNEFGVFVMMPVVRGVQHQRNLAKAYDLGPHRAFLEKIPKLPVYEFEDTLRDLDEVIKCYVRLIPTADGKVPPSPPSRTWFKVQFDNALEVIGKPHERSTDPVDIWHGHVVENDEGVLETGTSFCLHISKPPRAEPKPCRSFLEDLPNEKLQRVYLEMVIDTTAASRELDAAQKLADPTWEPETLGPIRQAFCGDPKSLPGHVTDLCKDRPDIFQGHMRVVSRSCGDNAMQKHVIKALRNVKDKLLAVVGPPGAGKTKTLANAIIAAMLQQKKVLMVGPSNKSVDNAAKAVWRFFPNDPEFLEKFPLDTRGHYNFLRYEVSSAERRAMIKVKNLAQQDPDKVPTVEEEPDVEEDSALRAAMAFAVREYESNSKLLRNLRKNVTNVKQALVEFNERTARRSADVPFRMTTNYHLFSLITDDEMYAEAEFEEEVQAWLAPKRSDRELKDLIEAGDDITEDHPTFKAYASDAMSREEVDDRILNGTIPNAAARNPSFKWVQAQEVYIRANGRFPNKRTERQFDFLYAEMMDRVFERIDCLFTTCNNAGSEYVAHGFDPDVLACDEAGQVNLASIAVVLTTFSNWLILLLFGDGNQLRPHEAARMFNEFRENARLSVLGLLEEKDFRIMRLNVQYRMAASIAKWVASYFYKGQLKNHVIALRDNSNRRVARQISAAFYGRKNGGSEFWVVNVMHGISRAHNTTTTLANHANAEALSELVDRFLIGGVAISDIAVLTYYTGQKFITIQKLHERATVNDRNWEVASTQISSVDAYQGQEAPFVIVDLVVAHLPRGTQSSTTSDVDDDTEIDSDEDGLESHGKSRSLRISPHVRDGHRLCCALTRAKDCLVVFMQLSVVLGSTKKSQTKERAAISDFARDAVDRRLVYDDDKHLDTSPAGLKMRAQWTARHQQHVLGKQKEEMHLAIRSHLRIAKNRCARKASRRHRNEKD